MTDETDALLQPELPISIGDRLRQARETAGLTQLEVAEQTRIPRRHVEAIETNELSALPNGPYAIGFARAIARVVGYPPEDAATAMRAEMARTDSHYATPTADLYEPADGSRIPPKALAWTAAIIGLLLVGGYTVWRTMGDSAPSEKAAPAAVDAANGAQGDVQGVGDAPASPAATLAGPLVIRAVGDAWFGLNDPATGRLAFERTLRAGETYAVPTEQRGLTLRTGRAQNLRLVVGTRELPQLGDPDILVRDVALDAASLSARASGAAAAPVAPAPTTPAP